MKSLAKRDFYPATWSLIDDDGETHSVPGLISFDEAKNPLVNLYGSLPGQWNDSFIFDAVKTQVFPLLHGETMESHWTLVSSRVVSYTRSMRNDVVDVVLKPRFALAGNFRLGEHELAVTNVKLTLWDQDAWGSWSDSVLVTNERSNERGWLNVSREGPEPIAACIDDATVLFRDDSPSHTFPDANGAVTVSATSAWTVNLRTPISLDELFSEWIEPLAFLITSATRRKTGLERMSVSSEAWVAGDAGEPMRGTLRLYAQSGARPEGALPEWGLLHRLSDWDFESQLPELFRFVRSHRSLIDQYLSYRNVSGHTWQMRFAVLYQIIETLDRALNPDPPKSAEQMRALATLRRIVDGEPDLVPFADDLLAAVEHLQVRSLAQRLSRLDSQAGGFLSAELADKGWKNDLSSLRNIVAHGLEASRELVADRGPLWTGTELIELLFEVRVLIELGFDASQAAAILRENPRWHGRITVLRENLRTIDSMISRAKEGVAYHKRAER
jgi:hypothetical protein